MAQARAVIVASTLARRGVPLPGSAAHRRRAMRALRSWHVGEEGGVRVADCGNNESAIEEVVVLFAGGLGDEKTSVAGGAKQEAAHVLVVRVVLGADWIVGAELAAFEGDVKEFGNATYGFHEATEGALGVG